MASATQLIKKKAFELGFQKVGICPAQAPSKLSLLSDWLDRGYHGSMLWLERSREKRLDVGRVLPGVRSIVVAAMNYYAARLDERKVFRISRYAHGGDYHRTIERRLQSLAGHMLELLPGARVLTYCDTGPIAEKVWAEAAGIGWQGKHSNLLTKDHSSWLFLGVLLTDALMEYDRPAANHCGTCTRCIDACPTQAITEAYVVDSRRCISYLTIEHHGVIPEALRPGIGNWIFGCDICQEACPWNRFSRPTLETDFLGLDNFSSAALTEWLEVSFEEFNRRFSGSPLRRARWTGLLRTLVIALGNARDPRHGPCLAKALNHPESLVRGHAAWALGRCPWQPTRAMLQSRLVEEPDPWVRTEISSALDQSNSSTRSSL